MNSGAHPALEEKPDRFASSDIPAAASKTGLHAANRSAVSEVALLLCREGRALWSRFLVS